ncbi:hypothetical protein QR66_10815 [Chromobacterium piscinae]|nr:hypothetical protein QR66_10815 [Chromobacterium piscinae]
MKIHHMGDHVALRRAAYPEVGEQLDALWKALAAVPLPPEAEAMRQRIQAIKQQYPKPCDSGASSRWEGAE